MNTSSQQCQAIDKLALESNDATIFEGGDEMAFDNQNQEGQDLLAPAPVATEKNARDSNRSGKSGASKRSAASKQRDQELQRQKEEAEKRRRATYVKAKLPSKPDNIGPIQKSEFDNREFKYLVLPNNMKVILISDPLADKSAASVEVQVGSLMDPDDYKGTAKFLQHMLLRGSKKYPKPEQFEEFLQRNGGSWNAFTTMTTTNFHFDIANMGFEEGLDRFSQFFISPAFAKQSTPKEIKNIHHQFKVALTNDFWHHTNLYLSLSHPESPINKFIFGNKAGLSKPEAYKAMTDFYKEYYSAELMTLCVSSNKPLAELEKKVSEAFKKVPFNEVSVPDFTNREIFQDPFGADQCKRLIKQVSIRSIDELKIVWHIPYYGTDINRYNARYFFDILGDEGQNSILSFLKSEGWATFLQVQKKSIIKQYTKFELTIELTPKGFKNYIKVVEVVFAQLQNLKKKGPQDRYFNEYNEAGQLKYAYQDRGKTIDQCVKLASKLGKINEGDIPLIVKHSCMREKFDKEGVRELTDMFIQPEKLMIFISSKNFEKEGSMMYEQWMLTKYKVEIIEGDLLNAIVQPNPDLKNKVIDLPPENKLLPKKFEIVPTEEEYTGTPKFISEVKDTDVWFRQETKFRHPKGMVHMKLYTSDNGFGFFSESSVFAYVWAIVQQDYQHEYLYQCSKAGLEFKVEINPDDVEFQWKGFSDSLQGFIQQVITNIITMRVAKARDLEPMFNNAKNWLMRDWQGAQEDKTYRQALDLFPKMLYKVISREKDLQRMLENYKFSQFFKELQTWLHSGTMVWFVHGNFTKVQANQLVGSARELLNLEEVTIEQLAKVGPLILKDGTCTVYEERIADKNNKQDCILAYYQIGLVKGDLKMSLCNNLLHTFMAIPFSQEMKQMRNLERVACRESYQRDCLGIWFLIQSDKVTSEYMSKCINDFLFTMKSKIKSFPKKDFDILKKAMADALRNQSQEFEENDKRLWQEIANLQFIFERPQKCIQLLDEITKDDFNEHFQKLFFSEESKRLDIQLVSEQRAKEQKKMYSQSKSEEMYKKVLKRQKYEGGLEWFKAYAKYDEDNLKSALTEWRKDEEPPKPIEETVYLGSMPMMQAEQILQSEKQMQESVKQDDEKSKFSEFKKLKKEIQEKRQEEAQSEAAQPEFAESAADALSSAPGDATKQSQAKRTFKQQQTATKKTETKSEAKKAQKSQSDMKSGSKLVGQKKPEEPEFKSDTGLSKRGVQALIPTKDAKEAQFTKVSFSNVYDSEKNPNGYLNMLVEENHLMKQALKDKLHDVCKNEEIPDSVFESQDWQGQIGFRQALAKYMQKYWFDRQTSADNICIQNGNGPAIESLISLFCNEGDTVIVPSPCNSSLFADLYTKSKVFVGAAQTSASNNFEPTIDCLEDAYEQAMMNGSKPKALLLSQPSSPTGKMMSPKCLLMCLQWAYEKEIHLISNELYAISLYDKQKMMSLAQVWFDEQKNKKNQANNRYKNWLQNQVHITGGLGKDFGINGFAVGFIYTKNEDILAASRSTFGMLHQVSSHTQFLLQKILEDEKWVDNFVKTSKMRLQKTRVSFKDALKTAGIPLFESQGTLMGWVDFRGYLRESSWQAETELWEELYKECGWMIKRGREYATSEPGWFCVMLTSQNFSNEEQMCAPFEELKKRLVQWKEQRDAAKQ